MPPTASVAPRILDPILALVERIDRTLRRIRPIRPGGMIGIEPRRHRGAPLALDDGTLVKPGDRMAFLHFDNRAVRRTGRRDWQTEGFRVARADLRALAAWHRAQPDGQRPMAYGGITLLAPLARRAGFESRARRLTPWVRLEDWYLRSLLVRWAPDGRARLARGSGPMRTREVWISAAELLRRYAAPSPPPPE